MTKLTEITWNTRQLTNGPLKVILSLGAEANLDGELEESFYVTVQESDQDIFQNKFESLTQALSFTNKTYPDWEVVDMAKPSDSGGCGSCSAH